MRGGVLLAGEALADAGISWHVPQADEPGTVFALTRAHIFPTAASVAGPGRHILACYGHDDGACSEEGQRLERHGLKKH